MFLISSGHAPSRELLRRISTRGSRVLNYTSRVSRIISTAQNNDGLQSGPTQQQIQCPYTLDNQQYGYMELQPQNSFSTMNVEVAEYEVLFGH
ncbi:hypothetical protein XENTR_v10012582 [Xenopus tropicalis]|nr:hypothetical protein XENTR_v10012582 [Xenopus tropicalis]